MDHPAVGNSDLLPKPKRLVSIVVPCFNEEEALPAFHRELMRVLEPLEDYDWEILLVDDGSQDNTWDQAAALAAQDKRVRVLGLSRNFGHQSALSAGLRAATGRAIITMDADLQHPPQLIPRMINLWEEGNEIVQTLRRSTAKISGFKRWSSRSYYWVFQRLSGCNLQPGAADFRLLDRTAAKALLSMVERERFLRGMVNWIGFRVAEIPFHAPSRIAGHSSYSFRKMLSLALSGILSFSLAPLRLASILGLSCIALSLVYLAYAIVIWAAGRGVAGWASLLAVIVLMGGLQLLILGIQGEYLGRVYLETKRRPIYVIRRRIGFPSRRCNRRRANQRCQNG